MSRSQRLAAALILLVPIASPALSVTACVHLPEHEPLPAITTPESYHHEGEKSTQAASQDPNQAWWLGFEDPGLNRLMEEAFAQNFDFQSAWARIDQANAIMSQQRAGRFPAVQGEANGGQGQRWVDTPTGAQSGVGNEFNLSLGASYEVDLWGKYRSAHSAAGLELEATRLDMQTLAMTLAAKTAETWYSWLALKAQVRLLQEQLGVQNTTLELVELRYQKGLTVSLDVYQQRQQVASAKAQLASARSQEAVLHNSLATLVGKTPSAFAKWLGEETAFAKHTQAPDTMGHRLPTLPDAPDAGTPAELLQQRPDVRAMQAQVEAADYRVGAAIAAMLPSLRLNASIGYSANSFGDLLDRTVWTILGGLTQPLFQGGRLRAQWQQAKSVLEMSLYRYAGTMLTAITEVENALVQNQRQRERLAHLLEQTSYAERALSEARSRYTHGLTDFLRVLSATQALHQSQLLLLGAERDAWVYRIQLHRALGGTWMENLQDPSKDGEENHAEAKSQGVPGERS